MPLTKRQKQVADHINDFQQRNGYSPSYEELAQALGLASLATVHKHISVLETKHYLRRGFNQSRSLELTEKYYQERRKQAQKLSDRMELPLVGRIAAGSPVESVEGHERLTFPDFAGAESVFALEVRGDSMIEDHICSGDYVLVESTRQVRDGDIVVALVRGSETTLKRFYKESGEVARLQPANSSMEPIRVPFSELQIQGRVLAVLRKYK